MCYVRSCTGVAYHLVFVFNVMQPPPAIKPCNLEASEDNIRFSKLSLGEAKGPSWLGVWFCSAGGLWLSGGCIEFKYYADVIDSGLTPPS